VVRAGKGKRRSLRLEGLLILRAVGGVFADAFLTASTKTDDRRLPRELGRYLDAQPLELIGVDLDRKGGNE